MELRQRGQCNDGGFCCLRLVLGSQVRLLYMKNPGRIRLFASCASKSENLRGSIGSENTLVFALLFVKLKYELCYTNKRALLCLGLSRVALLCLAEMKAL